MAFPLAPPSGMRDLLPPEAAARAQLASRLTAVFSSWGYALVTTPPFEHAEVIERGLDTMDRRDLLRFVEPETGEVALLRPDITPQIARIVATRLYDRPPPHRLCYAGSLIRQRRGGARRARQLMQAGVELIGLAGPDADVECVELSCRALEAAGLEDYVVELSLVSLARAALAAVPDAGREAVEEALSRKDGAGLERALREAGASREITRQLVGSAELYGGLEVLGAARALFTGARERAALAGLAGIAKRLVAKGYAQRLMVDLGEVRGASYYTGVSFRLLARGPGEPVGSGGRYDGLLARFGADLPATGFGIDLGHLEWALATTGRKTPLVRPPRVVVAGGSAARREALAERLRAGGIAAGLLSEGGRGAALDYARAWGYDAAVMAGPDDAATRRDGPRRAVPRGDLAAFAVWLRAHRSEDE